MAEEHGLERKALRWRHASALALASSTKLTHHTHVNEFFARLARDAARARDALAEWYGARSLYDLFDGTIAPDGYGVLSLPGRSPTHLLLELDRGTEPADRLRGHRDLVDYLIAATERQALSNVQYAAIAVVGISTV